MVTLRDSGNMMRFVKLKAKREGQARVEPGVEGHAVHVLG
jgi:hypothetical protein